MTITLLNKLFRKSIFLLVSTCFLTTSCSKSEESKAIESAKRLVAIGSFEDAQFRNVVFIKDHKSADNKEQGSLRGYVCGELKSDTHPNFYPNYIRFSINILLYENYTRSIAGSFKVYPMNNSDCDKFFEKQWQDVCTPK